MLATRAYFIGRIDYLIGAVYATALVKFNTTASPPFLLSVLVVLVYILGYFTNKRSINENN
jgi:hypothetical protein